MTKGCAMVDVPNRSSTMVKVHSATVPRCSGRFWGGAGVLLVVAVVAMNQSESAVPASLGEEVLREIAKVARQVARRGAGQTVSGRVVRPVNDQRLPDDILAWDEAPVARVERIVAVVPHGEEAILGNHDLAIHHMVLKHRSKRLVE